MSADLERRLDDLVRRGHHAVVAGVLRDGGEEVAGRGADVASRFEIGSITKVFTGVLLADMCLRGEVALEDPLSRHLPGPGPAWVDREPTLLELATHRTGLPNVPRPLARRELLHVVGLRRGDPWAGIGGAAYGRLAAATMPRDAPGGRVRYSSMGVGLLGEALAHRTGRAYADLLGERVLEPLGLEATTLDVPDDLLPGHTRRGRPAPPIRDHMPAAGSLRSTAGDMLLLLRACLAAPEGPLGPALALAQRPHARLGRHAHLGLCWMIAGRVRRRPRVVWHNGGTWGFRSWAGFVPGSGRAAVVLANTARGVERQGFALVT